MIKFKAKIETLYNMDGTESDRIITVPKFTTKHCDMAFFRKHKRYGGFANSTLFPSMLAKIRESILANKYGNFIKLSALPENVTVDESGFLASVMVKIAD